MDSLCKTLEEALKFNRQDAVEAAGENYRETVPFSSH